MICAMTEITLKKVISEIIGTAYECEPDPN